MPPASAVPVPIAQRETAASTMVRNLPVNVADKDRTLE